MKGLDNQNLGFSLLKIFVYFLHIQLFCLPVSVHHVLAMPTQVGIRSSRKGATDGCEMPYRCWELNLYVIQVHIVNALNHLVFSPAQSLGFFQSPKPFYCKNSGNSDTTELTTVSPRASTSKSYENVRTFHSCETRSVQIPDGFRTWFTTRTGDVCFPSSMSHRGSMLFQECKIKQV